MGMVHKIRFDGRGTPKKIVQIDEKEVWASKMDVHIDENCIPETEVTMNGELEMEYDSLVTFDFSPKTVKCAVNVLKAALLKNDFVAFMGMNDLMKIMEKKD